jgi:hypothetical protein
VVRRDEERLVRPDEVFPVGRLDDQLSLENGEQLLVIRVAMVPPGEHLARIRLVDVEPERRRLDRLVDLLLRSRRGEPVRQSATRT